jgi:hypothetical protein
MSASELYRPSDHLLSAKLVPTFADRGYHVVNKQVFTICTVGRFLLFCDSPTFKRLYSRSVGPSPLIQCLNPGLVQ